MAQGHERSLTKRALLPASEKRAPAFEGDEPRRVRKRETARLTSQLLFEQQTQTAAVS